MGGSIEQVLEALDPITQRLVPPDVVVGTLVPLKTVQELRDYLTLATAYVTRAPQKAVNDILTITRSIAGNDAVRNLPHLRRCIKPSDLPPQLKAQFINAGNGRQVHLAKSQWVYIVLGLKEELPFDELVKSLSTIELIRDDVFLGEIPVPLLAPTSQVQANMWSQQFWQAIYRKNNPLGPHPSTIARTESTLSRDASIWMAIAHQIAKKAQKAGMGEPIGAVVVKRTYPGKADDAKADDAKTNIAKDPAAESDASNSDGDAEADIQAQDSKLNGEAKETTQIVAVAGDARWVQQEKDDDTGNPMAHAALRVISVVAQKLVRAENRPQSDEPISEYDCFQDKSLLNDEKIVYDAEHPCPDGYLCHDLELYLTHEPCTMCAMAILHSRIGKIIFRKRMPLTGGMCSEDRGDDACGTSWSCSDGKCGGGQGLGLHWRKELNWTLLGWEWESDDVEELTIDPHTHA
ncbi:cytidine deaminase-like protein [Jackrogersella minutella]|nr:cytidine deaminase-like protein [Jackrogersella minutella]